MGELLSERLVGGWGIWVEVMVLVVIVVALKGLVLEVELVELLIGTMVEEVIVVVAVRVEIVMVEVIGLE